MYTAALVNFTAEPEVQNNTFEANAEWKLEEARAYVEEVSLAKTQNKTVLVVSLAKAQNKTVSGLLSLN